MICSGIHGKGHCTWHSSKNGQNHFILCIWRWYAVGFMARDTVHDIQVKMAAPHWWQIKLIFLWFWNYCTFEDQIYLCTFYEHHKTIANNIMDKILFKITQNISQVTFSRKPDDSTCAELYFFWRGISMTIMHQIKTEMDIEFRVFIRTNTFVCNHWTLHLSTVLVAII